MGERVRLTNRRAILTKENKEWIKENSSKYTAAEMTAHLELENRFVVRTFCNSHGYEYKREQVVPKDTLPKVEPDMENGSFSWNDFQNLFIG